MPGTVRGGIKASMSNKRRHGKDFYSKIGKLGGQKSRGGGFASKIVGDDGLTGPERAKIQGKIGGQLSRRGRCGR